MSFMEHLSELRLRLRNAAVVFLLAVMGSFFVVKHYFDYLTRPVRGRVDGGAERTRSRCSASSAPPNRSGSTPSSPCTAPVLIASPSSSGSCGSSSRRGLYKKESAWRWS